MSASTTGELGSSPSQPQPVAVATTLPTEATPSTRRFWSSASAKAGSLDSAMTTSICGYEATTEPPAFATSCVAVRCPGRAPDTGRRTAPPRPDQPAPARAQPRWTARQDEWIQLAASFLPVEPLPTGAGAPTDRTIRAGRKIAFPQVREGAPTVRPCRRPPLRGDRPARHVRGPAPEARRPVARARPLILASTAAA